MDKIEQLGRKAIHGEAAERAVLVGLILNSQNGNPDEGERSLAELAELASAAGAEVVGQALQRRQSADPAYLIGKGKGEEIRDACEALEANLVIFDEDLSGSQIRNLENLLGRKVIDRTFLILDIFAGRAQSRDGKLQVELAQQRYRLSRLVGIGQSLSRLGGGIGTRGPGETQLESDRRHINRRISKLKRLLTEIGEHRSRTRQHRQRGGLFTIAVVGYTNAGKSTLINQLCEASLETMDQVFATLDPAVRRLELPDGPPVLLVDTVGFIRKLPHQLVDAFKSTLEEVTAADAVLEVVDSTDPDQAAQMKVVESLLNELNAAGKPRLLVFNKADQLPASGKIESEHDLQSILPAGQQPLRASALTGQGMESLLEAIRKMASSDQVSATLLLPYDKTGLLDHIRRHGHLDNVRYDPDGITVRMRINANYFSPLQPYIKVAERPEKR